MRRTAICSVLLALAACGSHPLDGAWNQELAGGGSGLTLEFEVGGSRILGHQDVDGQHSHIDGTYTFDESTMAVTVKGQLMGAGKADSWTGKVAGEHLELSSADGKLEFHHGDHVHGH
ncbi:MAG: hypothetical protein KDC98_05445 [Planctomycetes bacterium]|nr:hypothetical protein [Planctomycetota bacterium]